jgi:hypothetical protein
LFECPNSSPVCPSGNGSTLMKMGVVHWLGAKMGVVQMVLTGENQN